MDNSMVSLKISEDMVQAVISKQLQSAIIAQLGNAEQYMAALISAALHQKVDSNGRVDSYAGNNKYDYLDILLKEKIREAAKGAIQEYVKENQEILKQALKKELEKTATKNKLVETFVDGATKAFACNWGFKCDVKFANPED